MNDDIYTVSEFSKKIHCSRGVVLRLIRDGKILAFRLSDAHKSPWRIKESEIERMISFHLHQRLLKDKK